MIVNREKIQSSLNELEATLLGYSLPTWEELPDIELYMDQVLSLMAKYLSLYNEAISTSKYLTASMINNYVKLGTIPGPEKKKYSRKHLAYLIIVCTLKNTLDMATIHKIIPCSLKEQEVIVTYNSFVKNQRKAFSYVIDRIKAVAVPVLENEGDSAERMNDLLMQVSASANIFKILTEKITNYDEINL